MTINSVRWLLVALSGNDLDQSTVFLQNGGSLEAAQDMANHSDPRTTKLYDRRKDLATLSEIERRIAF
jgi:hypothetical protein